MNIRRPSHIFYLIFILGFILYISFGNSGCNTSQNVSTEDLSTQYLGDQTCYSCHKEEYEDWKGSHHDMAMQSANAQTVLGDFDDKQFTSNGVTSRFYKSGDRFMVNTEGPEGSFGDFEITYTFGVYPLQQYMVEFPNGNLQCLLTAWDSEKQQWFDLMPAERIQPDDWLHWTKGSMTWNAMCADCHDERYKST